uniref:Clarin 1 n=1 Tax=Ornithorhynchus anatinus TaxID=9258 RepID=A0A6I8N1V7_ORNAN
MSSRQKKVIFGVAGLFSFACALGVLAATGTQSWIKGTIFCQTGALLVNASGQELEKFIGEIQYGLFSGERVRQCGLGGRPFQFSFFPDLLKVIPLSIHVSVILFSIILIVFTLVATAFFLFNAFGKPYETLHGPTGLYFWRSKKMVLGGGVVVVGAGKVKIHRLSEKIANYKEGTYIYLTHSENYASSFWVIFVCSFVHFLNGFLIRLAGFQFPFAKSKDSETTNGAVDLMY